jgi:alkanesulfonate monooxygenase SsuD/methylene tetrahydromethanopterin reductase-like flavin-dependent oxidoreductase (luciferase family)
MPYSVVRFNCIQPGLEPVEMAARYQAFVDMAGYADEAGLQSISLEEHHGAENGWSPSPLVMAGLVFGRTKAIMVSISALLVPLHDPLRIAEDIAVLDLASGGRLVVTGGIGYRPSEYEAHGKEWAKRGALQDEAIDTMLKAWTGEPFEYRGTTVQVTPRPFTQPHPTLMLGGSSKVAVRRAARFGLPYLPPANLPELEAYYYEQCKEFGTQGFCAMPPEHTAMTFVAEDPERVWRDLGHHFLHEAATYSSWQPAGQTSSVHSHASTVDELRAEGIYEVVTPAELVDRLGATDGAGMCALHPLVGGMPIDEGWSSLRLYVDDVLPALG